MGGNLTDFRRFAPEPLDVIASEPPYRFDYSRRPHSTRDTRRLAFDSSEGVHRRSLPCTRRSALRVFAPVFHDRDACLRALTAIEAAFALERCVGFLDPDTGLLTWASECSKIKGIRPLLVGQTQGVITMSQTAVSVFDLSPSEKLQLVEDLWDDLAAIPSDVPIPDWQLAELDRRKANLKGNPASGISWDQVKRSVRTHHGR